MVWLTRIYEGGFKITILFEVYEFICMQVLSVFEEGKKNAGE